jgi:hypothetical protein
MKAEKKAIQKAAFLFIAPRKDILRRRVIAGQTIRPSKFPTGMRGYNQMLTPDLQEGPN